MGSYKNIAGFVVGLVLLSGCAINTKFYNESDALVGRIEQDQPGAASFEGEKGMKMTVDTRKPTLWDRFIMPMVQSAAGTSQGSVRPK